VFRLFTTVMEAFETRNVRRTRTILGIVATANVAITLLSGIVHVLKFAGEGFGSPASLIFAAVSLLHFVGSGMSIAVALTGFDVLLARASTGVAIFVLLIDVLGVLLRPLITVTDSFRILMLFLGGIWIFLTAVEVIVLAILISQSSKARRDLRKAIREEKAREGGKLAVTELSALLEAEAEKVFWSVPVEVYRARKRLQFLWAAELVTTILFLFVFSPGFVNNTLMTVLAFLTLPHLFQWSWVRAVAGPSPLPAPPNPAVTDPASWMLCLTRALNRVTLILDIVSMIIRTIMLFLAPSAFDGPRLIVFVGAPVTAVFSFISLIIVFAFAGIDALQSKYLGALVKGLHAHRCTEQGRIVAAAAQRYKRFKTD
jgi:hypothetical protein